MEPLFSIRFDLRNGDYGQYRRNVLNELQRVCDVHRQILVVGPKRDAIWNWFFLEVTCGDATIVLGICADTLYQYTWRKGGLQENFAWSVIAGANVHGLPGGQQNLTFSGSYTEIGDPHTVSISRESLAHSVRVLYNSNNTEEAKTAFLRLVVTFCAGVRIKMIYNKIYNMLHRGVRERLSLHDTEREKNWSSASSKYLEGNETVEVRGYGFLNDETARKHLTVLLNDATCKHKLPSPNCLCPSKKPDREKKRDDGESSGTNSERALVRKRNNHASASGNSIDFQTRNNTMASKGSYNNVLGANKTPTCNFGKIMESDKTSPARPVWKTSKDDDMYQLDDGEDIPIIGSSFNPMLEPSEEWSCKFNISPEKRKLSSQHLVGIIAINDDITRSTPKGDCSDADEFLFPTDAACEDDDEVTEFNIRAFLDEKIWVMKGEESLFGLVHRSLVFRPNPSTDETPNTSIVDRIGLCICKSQVGLGLGFVLKIPLRQLTMGASVSSAPVEEPLPRIRWRKGEVIGCGTFGQVFMWINLDFGKLLAVKQVSIGTSNASKEKDQARIREFEEEVKLLKNLLHPNIVRYLGTVREENTLNILLEFVPSGSISSLLSKFGSLPEPVTRTYTKKLLQGLEYLHQNKIIHRDIKENSHLIEANILVDNTGCIKLADFGASKKVAKLATITATKSMKGTPYWMAPEVIVQSGHSFSADIWSVGCTVIEMATGKPPWIGQYQEVAALFHVGTTKSHPPIPEHLSLEAKNFLLKCLQEEPSLRPTASDLLRHPFVTGELEDAHQLNHAGSKESYNNVLGTNKTQTCNFGKIMESDKVSPARPVWETSNDDDMCRLDDGDDFPVIGSSFNPMSEPLEEWPCMFDISPEKRTLSSQHLVDIIANYDDVARSTPKGHCSDANEFSFPSDAACEDDDEVTEIKVLDLKKLQTPLYEEFYNSLNASNPQVISSVWKENMNNNCNDNTTNASKLPPMTPSKNSSAALPTVLWSGSSRNARPGGSFIWRITYPQRNEWVPPKHHSDNQEPLSPSASFSERS